ncbi:MAG: hypothetical protein WA728_14540 [Xanthobacteraceae bacterium]
MAALSALSLQRVASFWKKSLVCIETPNKNAPLGALDKETPDGFELFRVNVLGAYNSRVARSLKP